MKRTLKKVGPLSCGKIFAALYFAMSLIFLPILGLSLLIPTLTGAQTTGGAITGGVVMMLVLPLFYAILGFLTGVIGGWLYNIFARWIGGIEFEVE